MSELKESATYSTSLSLPYSLGLKIASGSFADVYLGYGVAALSDGGGSGYQKGERCMTNKSDNKVDNKSDDKKKPYAIKVLDLDNLPDIDSIHQEISTLRQHSCEYLVRYYGSYLVKERLWVVMEWCVGSVWDFMCEGSNYGVGGSMERESDKNLVLSPLPESSIKNIMSNLLKGLKYLHEDRKIHRDIKSKNCLIDTKGGAKLSDFGETAQLTDTMTKRATFVGSPFWMAPEVISQR